MSDRMRPPGLRNLLQWIVREYSGSRSIFGIPLEKFYYRKSDGAVKIFGERLGIPAGPAAGPHTQMAQNIAAAYLAGGRFFELKTVQVMDDLHIEKPCIDAEDEGYNVEWSQELSLDESFDEYLKAWLLLNILHKIFGFSEDDRPDFIFNMSVGYDLKGIKSVKTDNFIEQMKDASRSKLFGSYKDTLIHELTKGDTAFFLLNNKFNGTQIFFERLEETVDSISGISPHISGSVTLSTMHGCPPDDIEAIARYLISEKGLHTFVKLNPTLLGYDTVNDILSGTGYDYISLSRDSFEHDMGFEEAVKMIGRMKEFSAAHKKEFGIKLSNTLGVNNNRTALPGEQMYMSGRSLYPLTINLAYKLTEAFNGDIKISYSGGANSFNTADIINTGIYPVTIVTELLKPGGYLRLSGAAEEAEKAAASLNGKGIDSISLKQLALKSTTDRLYEKSYREKESIKSEKALPRFDCFTAPCSEACPIHQSVPEYIRLEEAGLYEEAFEVITKENPLPNITGYICDHQCMVKCTRRDYDKAVEIRELKKEAAEKGSEAFMQKAGHLTKAEDSGIKAAVIGAGPAGLAASYFLSKGGIDVTVFEKESGAGGTVKHVIPGFRLPASAIEKDVKFIEAHGVKFKFGADEKFSVSKLKSEGYKYIFIGTGAPEPNDLELEGDKDKVIDAVRFLRRYNKEEKFDLGKTAAVIGGGNSAMDGARAALRTKGVERVYIVYRRTKEFMPADKEEFDAAVSEGAVFKDLLLPVSLKNGILRCQKMKLGETGSDGRRSVKPFDGVYEEIRVDSVISAIGEHADYSILRENRITGEENKVTAADKSTNQTEVENVYIGGDALRGPSTVVESIADGRKAAEAILRKEGLANQSSPEEKSLKEKQDRYRAAIIKRGITFAGVEAGGTEEYSKCLECDILCSKCVEVCPNRANIAIDTMKTGIGFKDMKQIIHLDALCNECGNCETFCPYRGAPYKDKITVFTSEEDFRESTNEGFYLLDGGESKGELKFKVRLNGETGIFTYTDGGKKYTSTLSGSDKETGEISRLIFTVYADYNYLFGEKTENEFSS